MANTLWRNDRRRRVLNEDVLSASSAHVALRAGASYDEPAENAPRYSEAAGVEHHPQVTDFLPRRYRAVAVLVLAGLTSTAAVEALYWFAGPAAARYAGDAAAAFDLGATGSVGAWLSAVLLLGSAATCLIIYSLRRHRIDDYRGRYRVWLAAAIACGLLSFDSVAPVHRLIAAAAAYHSGWTALRANAAWWLILGGLPLAWIAARAWLDARESRLAATAFTLAFLSYGIALAGYLTGWPTFTLQGELIVTAGAMLIGHWLLLVGTVSYGRFVVLDVQGLVTVRRRQRRTKREAKDERNDADQTPAAAGRQIETAKTAAATATAPSNTLRAFRQNLQNAGRPSPAQATQSRWIDGSEPIDDDFSDEDSGSRDRKLSKADRKRLRKLKAQERAA